MSTHKCTLYFAHWQNQGCPSGFNILGIASDGIPVSVKMTQDAMKTLLAGRATLLLLWKPMPMGLCLHARCVF